MSRWRITEATFQKVDLGKPSIPTRDQERRRRVIELIELAIVSETRATIANVRITTTTQYPLLGREIEGQVNCQIQVLYFQ